MKSSPKTRMAILKRPGKDKALRSLYGTKILLLDSISFGIREPPESSEILKWNFKVLLSESVPQCQDIYMSTNQVPSSGRLDVCISSNE